MFEKPYHFHFISLTHTFIHCHCWARIFSSFCNKTCWLRFISVKHLLVTHFNPKISQIAARFHRVFEPSLDWVWTIPTELARVCTGSVLLWLCIVCLHQFEVVLIQLISNPCSWTSIVRVCGTNLGIFEVSRDYGIVWKFVMPFKLN